MNVFNVNLYIQKASMAQPCIVGAAFLLAGIAVYVMDVSHYLINFALGLMACYAVIAYFVQRFSGGEQSRFFAFMSRYTLPIFLMHTLCAAPLRVVLLKLGVQAAWMHLVFGVCISFVGPMIVAKIMKKTKWLEFFLYPGKFVRVE